VAVAGVAGAAGAAGAAGVAGAACMAAAGDRAWAGVGQCGSSSDAWQRLIVGGAGAACVAAACVVAACVAAAGDRACQWRACQRREWGSGAAAVWDARQRLTVGLHALCLSCEQ
jgi:hypothetical protein